MLREIRLYIQSGSCVLGHWPQKTTSLCKSAMKQLKIEESIRYVVVDRLNSYQYPIGIRLSLFLMLCVSQSQLVLPTTYANRFHPTNQPSFVGKNVFWFHFSCHKVEVSDGIAPTLFPPSISSSILLLPQMHTEHQLGGGGVSMVRVAKMTKIPNCSSRFGHKETLTLLITYLLTYFQYLFASECEANSVQMISRQTQFKSDQLT